MVKRKKTDGDADCGPVYGYSPNSAGRNTHGCSGSSDFCFLCEFSRLDCGDTNYVEEIRRLAMQLGHERKELPIVARAVSRAYEEGPQPWVVWEHPETGERITSPTWSREAITRHLLHSPEFGFYNDTVNYIFQRIIAEEQATVLQPIAGGVHQDQKDNLLRTIAAYGDWLVKRRRIEEPRVAKRT